MKLVFISDLHVNLPALDAVWKSIQQHEPYNIFCIGDLVNFAGWDNEVIDFIRKHGVTTVQGYHDEGRKTDLIHYLRNSYQNIIGIFQQAGLKPLK